METNAQDSAPPAAANERAQASSSGNQISEQRDGENTGHKMGGNGQGATGGRKGKRHDLGRKAWGKQNLDKRKRNAEEQETKRQKLEAGQEVSKPIYATEFSKEEIEADQRRPKKKVAVLLGYSGTGYHGMQLSATEKTIEGDLFTAFVAAGAISKANAADPKKSSLVRCARTDKGVHAAGNIVSLKLIVEDKDVIEKINSNLSPQIRVWGYEITNKSFSCYQHCDSRIYEYLIPSHCLLPPHPSTVLGRKIQDSAENFGIETYNERQKEVLNFWKETDAKYVRPILEGLAPRTRELVERALLIERSGETEAPSAQDITQKAGDQPAEKTTASSVNEAILTVRAAYLQAKKDYRIPPERMARLNEALSKYVGTRNFHNYTIQKSYLDASAKRHMKFFSISRDPLVRNGTEWLSLKVHGQSFMMHQIRKMVAMATMLVRSGGNLDVIPESYTNTKISIPKAPGLGLLLERPIFNSYNERIVKADAPKNPIDFSKHDDQIEEFKQREIYTRIFDEEAKMNAFSNFFNHLDTFQDDTFLYVTQGGISAAPQRMAAKPRDQKEKRKPVDDDLVDAPDEELVNNGEDGG